MASCSPLSINRRGANSTRPHERHCEAPLREARQAAPDWARASAALSSSKNSQFSRGTWPLRRESCCFVATSCVSANSITGNMINRIRARRQHRFHFSFPSSCDAKVGVPSSLFRYRAAADSRDEILRAKLPGGGGRVKVEARAAGAHNLDATDAATQSNKVSSRCPSTSRLARQLHADRT